MTNGIGTWVSRQLFPTRNRLADQINPGPGLRFQAKQEGGLLGVLADSFRPAQARLRDQINPGPGLRVRAKQESGLGLLDGLFNVINPPSSRR